jgi:hypothetical protein
MKFIQLINQWFAFFPVPTLIPASMPSFRLVVLFSSFFPCETTPLKLYTACCFFLGFSMSGFSLM